ncbi:hypothetical protein A2291_04895 [candidate division WOR-1 bacterium RIFOXYB2_FULL_42_35]|uniref:Porin domain-containing protein n=1 Tax=candidate division WOR-1 bacterium RIFOXYC2_FULL_41_25 TaxID=1802586 RepID=A0A1F4TN78_UNCSA|nr:MAG: hypothetical protein A2247_07095 [candidate division WOR-1 bacterium RIFOXYA2_FULL_41_14]OGC24667.1 MAG: hypothetical protein A2291_04895 [candidate division WOR-1 bacterium RIFOXYB2_FULL_42_35]OGC34182.1 MAG: hypothetical protein A2462_08140 [candidate division WOR-1 bacterium RIFOXYC2_FULL_41_25]OGC42456.1 MAG: hypothetical protein A2548_05140 [candidate division WOR-1 bacterium RIFOXYD2_FULL_41_8]
MKKILVLVLASLFLVSSVSFAVDLSTVKMNGDFRFRYTMDQTAGNNDAFGTPRARIKLSGQVNDDLLFVIQPDFAGLATGANVALADAYADLKCKIGIEKTMRFGQFLVPFAYDSGKYNVIVYPSHYNVIVPDRDWGLGVLGKAMAANYFVSLTNGNRSATDNNESKDLAAMVILPTQIAELGLSGYYGKTGATSVQQTAYGAYVKANVLSVDALLEYVAGDNWAGTAKLSNLYLNVSKKLGEIEPLVQYQIYDADTNTASNIVNTLTVGFNKYLDSNGSCLMLNYNIVNEETTSVDNNTLILQARVKI